MHDKGLVRGLGFFTLTALVAGNVIGSGVYAIPASLADAAGPLGLLAWPIVGLAYLALTAAYADLGQAYPVQGGLQVYAQRAFGERTGAISSFLYWVSGVSANAAFTTAFVGYAAVFFPALHGKLAAFLAAQAMLWGLTLVNVLGVKASGRLGLVATALKVVPLFVLAFALIPMANPENLAPFAPHGFAGLFPAISLVAWAFLGAESVGVPAEETKDAARTIRRAAYAGYALTIVVYLAVAVTMALAFPSSSLAGHTSPLSMAAEQALGPWGGGFVALGAMVSTFGALNGWLLVVGRLPYAAARDGVAPKSFAALHPRFGTPARALVISTMIPSALLIFYFVDTFLGVYNLVALLSNATGLVSIALACAALPTLVRREGDRFTAAARARAGALAVAGVAISILLVAGSGWKVLVATAFMVVLAAGVHAVVRARA